MKKKLVALEQANVCRAKFDFKSLTSLTTTVGLCAGVVSIPLILILSYDKLVQNPWEIWFIVIGAPISGLLNGLLYGALGFFPYKWLTRLVNVHTYTGEFTLLKEDDSQT